MDDAVVRTIAERFGTPTYVYDLRRVRSQWNALRTAFPGARLLYAVKANPSGAVLRALAHLGAGAEVITLGELERAVRAGIGPADVLVGGPGQDAGLVGRASELGVGLASLDSAGTWHGWQAAGGESTRFLVRVNPGLDPGTHKHLATGAAASKFGLPPEPALALAREVRAAGRLAGFHVHAGSMIRDPAVYEAVHAVLAPLYRALPGLDLVDLGGGFAVPDGPLTAFGARAGAVARALGASLAIEPGRSLVAEAGTLLTRVLHVKPEGPRRHVIADAGMADLLRPALYGAEHPIRVVASRNPTEGGPAEAPDGPLSDLDGPLCENADRLGRDRRLPPVAPGDLLAVEQAGAYGFAMASNYASSLRPAEVVVDDGAMQPAWEGRVADPGEGPVVRLVRRRERPEDLWRLEIDTDPR
jgi:diaminopimelate decarboxylase